MEEKDRNERSEIRFESNNEISQLRVNFLLRIQHFLTQFRIF